MKFVLYYTIMQYYVKILIIKNNTLKNNHILFLRSYNG